MADVAARPGPAVRPADRGGHRPAVLRRLQSAAAGQRRDAGGAAAEVLPVLLAHPSLLALPDRPGDSHHAGPGAAACGAGEAVVGATEALLLAAGALAGACPGTPQPGDDRRRRPVRGRHRHPQHTELLHRSLVLHRPPVRRPGVPGGAPLPPAPAVSAHARLTAVPPPAT